MRNTVHYQPFKFDFVTPSKPSLFFFSQTTQCSSSYLGRIKLASCTAVIHSRYDINSHMFSEHGTGTPYIC